MFKKGKYWSNLMAELFLSRDPRFIPSIEKKKPKSNHNNKKMPKRKVHTKHTKSVFAFCLVLAKQPLSQKKTTHETGAAF